MKSIKPKKIKYLCVDTNIFIQCCFLEIDGDNLDVLNKLHFLLDRSRVKLLLPEVIKLELYKNTFDIVILNDGLMEIINNLIREIKK